MEAHSRFTHTQALLFPITDESLPVFSLFESAFTTAATFVRAKLLGVAAILTEQRLHLWCLAIPIGCLLLVIACDLVRPLAPGPRKEGG